MKNLHKQSNEYFTNTNYTIDRITACDIIHKNGGDMITHLYIVKLKCWYADLGVIEVSARDTRYRFGLDMPSRDSLGKEMPAFFRTQSDAEDAMETIGSSYSPSVEKIACFDPVLQEKVLIKQEKRRAQWKAYEQTGREK